MDVVYNHVYDAETFCFNQIVPVYFSRTDLNGKYSNASACGNDTASERSMVKKYIVDSVKYWADEYHIDGFRFDLVGLIDTDTINAVMAEVHKTHPNVIFYGEGWSMDTLVTKPDYHMTTQANANLVPGFAFFSDTVRDILKGSVFENTEKGFVSGEVVSGKLLHQCFMGTPDWACEPAQSVNYVSCHDNNTLIDRITLSTPECSRADRVKMNNLAAAFVLTSQGAPFFQAGEEFLRTKPLPEGGFEHNSYVSPDSVNAIRWNCLETDECMQTMRYYQGLIQLRKAHPALRLSTRKEAAAQITPVNLYNPHAVAYQIHGKDHEDLFLIFNANHHPIEVALPSGSWHICVNSQQAGVTNLGTVKKSVTVDGISAMVLVKKESSHVGAILLGAAAVGAAALGTAIALTKKGKK
jgi:pullulanase